MNIHQLAADLERLANATPGAKTQNPRSAMYKIVEYLLAFQDQPLSELIVEAEAAAATKTAGKSAKPKKVSAPDLAVVERYLSELKQAEAHSPEAFAQTLTTIGSDKKVRLVELKELCSMYTGDAGSLTSKKAALGKMTQTFEYRWKLNSRSQ